MLNSPLFVFWKNSTGGCVVSERVTDEYELPAFSNNQLASVTRFDPKVTAAQVKGSNLRCTISRPNGQSPIGNDFIWAIGEGVETANNPRSSFEIHSERGPLNVGSGGNGTKNGTAKKENDVASLSALSALSLIISSIFFL